ncbi:MAG: zinc-finger domain-containing protein [Rhodospirillaceae bacterium]|nr:zinc-finger domain-containing protein [Rhodospirillaceae bacterium]|tara:strand:+ start:6903 stop:7130 length:228 start_codon:yes stop_codon:yes gene_type:complete
MTSVKELCVASNSANNAPQPPEIIEVEELVVACDGGGGALGHPRVFLTLDNGRAECGYCDRLFILKAGVKVARSH